MKSLDFSALYLLIAITSAASKSHCASQPAVATTYKPLTKGFPTNIDPLTATVQELNGFVLSITPFLLTYLQSLFELGTGS